MNSTIGKTKTRTPHLTQSVRGEAKAKLQSVVQDLRDRELTRLQATHFLRQQVLEDWLRDVTAVTLPLGPRLLPKTVKNIDAWQKLTPVQKAERKEADIKQAREARAAAKAKRAAKKVSA